MLAKSIELFWSSRAATLDMVQKLSEGQMDYQPAPGKWSIGEVLDHLILAQRLNGGYIVEVIEMKKAGKRPLRKLSFADVDVSIGHIPKSLLTGLETPFTILNMFVPPGVRDFLTRNRLVPAQNPSSTTPRRARPPDELRADLISSLKETEQLLQSNPELDYGEMRIRHPLLGDNNIPALLRFIALHEQRHQSQIGSVLRSPGFPSAP